MLAIIFSVPKIPKLQVDERENSEKSQRRLRTVTTQFPVGLKAGAVPGRPSTQQPAAMWPSRRPHWRRDGCKCGRPPAWPHPPRGRSAPSFLSSAHDRTPPARGPTHQSAARSHVRAEPPGPAGAARARVWSARSTRVALFAFAPIWESTAHGYRTAVRGRRVGYVPSST